MASGLAPLTDERVLQQIDPIFHSHWKHLRKTRLLESEEVFGVAYHVVDGTRWKKTLLGPEVATWPWFGLLVITSRRLLRLRFATDKQRTWICHKQDPIIRHLKSYWVPQPTGSLTQQESKEWEVDEKPLSEVKSVNFDAFRLRDTAESNLIQLKIGDFGDALCEYEAGHRLYLLLQIAVSNRGQLVSQPPSTATDPLQPLKYLIDARQAGMLTEAEFKVAKAKLLGL